MKRLFVAEALLYLRIPCLRREKYYDVPALQTELYWFTTLLMCKPTSVMYMTNMLMSNGNM